MADESNQVRWRKVLCSFGCRIGWWGDGVVGIIVVILVVGSVLLSFFVMHSLVVGGHWANGHPNANELQGTF